MSEPDRGILSLQRGTNLRHHAAPSDKVCCNWCAFFLLMSRYGFQQTVEMIIAGIVKLLKAFEALAEADRKGWWIIISQG